MSERWIKITVLIAAVAVIPAVNLAQAAPAHTSPAHSSDLTIKSGIDPAVLAKAKSGDAEAQFLVAAAYRNGTGVSKDPALSASWLRKSAEQGLAIAQFDLGLCYNLGRGVPQDYAQALAWYRKSAAQNNPSALVNLAVLYHLGNGVPKDEKQAFEYIRQAAEAGAPDAQFQLGMDYNFGAKGLKLDQSVAVEWFRKSAEQGTVGAQVNLAMLLHDQPEETYYWLALAVPHLTGDTLEKATKIRDGAAAALTPAKRAEIDQRIQQWLDAHHN